jgi:two-component system response regulator GlrR
MAMAQRSPSAPERRADTPREESRRVLLVDDNADLLRMLQLRLATAGYAVETATDGRAALGRLAEFRPHLVISDLRMPGSDGLELLDEIHRRRPGLPVVLLSGEGTIPEAVSATQSGAFDFITKPVDSARLLALVARATALSPAAEATPGGGAWSAEIVTRSPRLKQTLEDARQVAGSDASVLITGESGTGKELLARAVHRASSRRERPFVAINCGAMPEQLLESELFGHRKGAFTGAVTDHGGLIRAAQGGTLLLDEIGDMPLPLQVKLVRVLQERQIRPVGSVESFPVDVRVISATHRDLKAALREGRMREDLYYRLNVVELQLPPLREHPEDIPLLAAHHLRQLAQRRGAPPKVYAPDAMELLAGARWPGNVRQLFNVVEHNDAISKSPVIGVRIVQQTLGDTAALPTFAEARDEFVRAYLTQLLQLTGENVTRAAKLADRNRSEFYKLLATASSRSATTPATLPEGDSALPRESMI